MTNPYYRIFSIKRPRLLFKNRQFWHGFFSRPTFNRASAFVNEMRFSAIFVRLIHFYRSSETQEQFVSAGQFFPAFPDVTLLWYRTYGSNKSTKATPGTKAVSTPAWRGTSFTSFVIMWHLYVSQTRKSWSKRKAAYNVLYPFHRQAFIHPAIGWAADNTLTE